MEFNEAEMIKRFVETRKKYGTQEKLGNAIGINSKTISAYETGKKLPSLRTFIKICIEMGADANYILFGNDMNNGNDIGGYNHDTNRRTN